MEGADRNLAHLLDLADPPGRRRPGLPVWPERPVWRYEFALFEMFWVYYVANTPRLAGAGATRPLLDAYHEACYRALKEAGLLEPGPAASMAWDDDVEERSAVYKRLWEEALTQEGPPRIYAATVGEALVHRFVYRGRKVSGRFPGVIVACINEFGSITFRTLVGLIEDLERRYSGG